MESMGVFSTPIDVRHEAALPSNSMSPTKPKPLKATTSLHPGLISSPTIRAHVSTPSRRMISSPLRTCTPVTSRRTPPPPIDTSHSRSGSQPLERVPTEPASAPPPPQQPTPDELAALGIKVRDFAYEPSTLPRVPTVRKPYIRELKRPREETAEEREARKRNEARRLEFNSPRTRPLPSSSIRNPSHIAGVGGLGFIKAYDMPSSRTSSSSSFNASASASASANSSSSPKSRPLQRQPTERDLPCSNHTASTSITIPRTGVFFAKPQSQRRSPSPPRPTPAPRVRDTFDLRTREYFKPLPKPRLDSESQSQSQSESQSQAKSSSQPSLPALSMSQTDSELDDSDLDDEEYVKTPLVTPNGSLFYPDDENIDGDGADDGADNAESPDDADAAEVDNSIIDTSTLPESQVAELLANAETGPDEDVSASQMGLCESQDLSQPAWQQQSQSQSPQHQGQEQDEDVEMPDSQPVNKEGDGETSDCTPTPTPTSSSARTVVPTVVTPARLCASASSNNVASSSQPRPISRVGSYSSLSRRSSSSRALISASSHSLLRRSSSLSSGLSRHASLTSSTSAKKSRGKSNVRTSPGSSSTSSSSATSTPSKRRNNLRTPSPRKAKLLGVPTSLSAHRLRVRSSPQRAAAAAASATRSAAQVRARARGKATDAVMDEDAGADEAAGGAPGIAESPVLRSSVRGQSG